MHPTRTSANDPPGPPHPHPAAFDDARLLKDCRLGKGRSGGPGGQHRNKVETTVFITHLPTGTESHAAERRSAEENRKAAVFRLRLALATDVRCALPPGDAWGDARSALWRVRCRDGKIACNPEHRDFPSLLAEALDTLHACGLDEHKAALRLECTPSQLIRFVREHAPAMSWWNRGRAAAGKHPLK